MKSTHDTEASSLEELELDLLLDALERRFGYDFRNYARASLKRRVRKVLQDLDVTTISGLQERLLHHPDLLRTFLATVSVNITSLFRNPRFYVALRQEVVPLLRTYPFVRIWVAGCATGEEIYSMAILLQEEGLYARTRVYATDLSDDLLEQAAKGQFPLDRMQQYTHNYLHSGGKTDFSSYYRVHGNSVILDPKLRTNLVFSQHNLAADGAFNEFHLILCRNVMIYFDETLRNRVHSLIFESLVNFGILGLGMKESIRFSPHVDAFVPVNADMRIYKRSR